MHRRRDSLLFKLAVLGLLLGLLVLAATRKRKLEPPIKTATRQAARR